MLHAIRDHTRLVGLHPDLLSQEEKGQSQREAGEEAGAETPSSTQAGWGPRVCVPSCFGLVQLFATLWPVARQAPLSVGFSRQEYCRGGCRFLLQGIFPIQGLNLCLLLGRQILYPEPPGKAPNGSNCPTVTWSVGSALGPKHSSLLRNHLTILEEESGSYKTGLGGPAQSDVGGYQRRSP